MGCVIQKCSVLELLLDAGLFPHNNIHKKINITMIFTNLRGYGIQGNLLSWIEAFLTRRKQRVFLNFYCSTWADVVSSVPQGSVLGPLLFNIYVNDIPDVVSSPILLFTDDIKIFRCIKTYQDYIQLQSDLNCLSERSLMWKLKFNISKCNVLHLGFSHQQHIYYLSGAAIQPVLSVRDLGVIIDYDLKFHEHTSGWRLKIMYHNIWIVGCD